jgi:glycine/D-amino acid oxidase-like deaminating enzyme
LLWDGFNPMNDSDPLWLAGSSSPDVSSSSFREGMHADVAVIGGGITGLTAALLLRERGRQVIVLEQERIGAGESGRTTAHITAAIDARYRRIERTFGKAAAKTVAAAGRAAIEQMASLVERYSIGCRFRRLPGFLYTERRSKVAELKGEAVSAREAGLAVSWVTEVPLPFQTRGAVRFEDQAQFEPLRYLLGIATQLADSVVEGIRVERITEGDPCVIETDRGRITADAVFVTGNVEVGGVALPPRITRSRTYVLAMPVEGEPPEGLFRDTADPYHYTRWQETDQGLYLLVGGEDHPAADPQQAGGAFERLQQFAVERFGGPAPRYRWWGEIVESFDGLPLIGPLSAAGKIYQATAFAGQGTTFGTVAAMIVADQLTGRPNAWSQLFEPRRGERGPHPAFGHPLPEGESPKESTVP